MLIPNLLAPIDGSESSFTFMNYAMDLDLASSIGSQPIALHIVPPNLSPAYFLGESERKYDDYPISIRAPLTKYGEVVQGWFDREVKNVKGRTLH
jgi:hypothetical protein